MSNPFDDIRRAVSDARQQLLAADETATDLARLLDGRLHHVKSIDILAKLKKQLKDFNMHTGKWMDKQP